MVSHWNFGKSLLKRYLILSVHIFTDLLPMQLSIAVEEGQGPEVTSIIDPQGSLCQYQGIIGKLTGQMHTLTLTELDLLISLGIMTGIDITHIHHLKVNICITRPVILTKIVIMCLIMQLICIPYTHQN